MPRPYSAATMQALELVRQGMPAYRAALIVGIQPSTIYRALKQQRRRHDQGNQK